jgi:hypothetical protein
MIRDKNFEPWHESFVSRRFRSVSPNWNSAIGEQAREIVLYISYMYIYIYKQGICPSSHDDGIIPAPRNRRFDLADSFWISSIRIQCPAARVIPLFFLPRTVLISLSGRSRSLHLRETPIFRKRIVASAFCRNIKLYNNAYYGVSPCSREATREWGKRPCL